MYMYCKLSFLLFAKVYVYCFFPLFDDDLIFSWIPKEEKYLLLLYFD